MSAKLWGGRFAESTEKAVDDFGRSLDLDRRLCRADLLGSIAHAEMLGACGILSQQESIQLVDGLHALLEEETAGRLEIDPGAEDIHSAIEQLLFSRLGSVAGKLHTARSRNDQVATACRLYLREEAEKLQTLLACIQNSLVAHSERHTNTLLPGLTHMQHAQPVSLAHHLLAYFWMFQRDRERLRDFLPRLNCLPLGSGALAGTTLPIRRELTAEKLEFSAVCENSLDAVSDRDFVVEFLSFASLTGIHLSRLAEELIVWSTPEFGFLEMADSVTTGSSLMPQKKNPDVAELIRGKTGRLSGALMGSLTLLKALPLSYNRDLQEDKFHLFAGLDTLQSCLQLMNLLLEKVTWKPERMRAACRGDQSNSTDLADYLVRKGVPFRTTHEIAGRAVRLALEKGVGLEDLSLPELQELHPLFAADVFAQLAPEAVMGARNSRGGTGTAAVKQQLAIARAMQENSKAWKSR
jgi:argininosuccinate lyase